MTDFAALQRSLQCEAWEACQASQAGFSIVDRFEKMADPSDGLRCPTKKLPVPGLGGLTGVPGFAFIKYHRFLFDSTLLAEPVDGFRFPAKKLTV